MIIVQLNLRQWQLVRVKAHANGRNIVGAKILRPIAWNHNNVGTC